MTDHFEIMPQYLGALELELRSRAAGEAQPQATPFSWRRPALAVLFAALMLVPALLLAGTVGDATRAYGRPAILDTPPIPIPDEFGTRFRPIGPARGSRVTEARPIAAVSGAYVLTGDGVWCLVVPDSASTDPLRERLVTCITARQFAQFGLSSAVSHQYVVVLPAGVRPPTLTRAGVTVTLKPDEQGVVAIGDFHRGDTVTLYSPDGKERADHAA